MASSIGVRLERVDDVLLARISGELDIAAAPRVREDVLGALEAPVAVVALELSGVGFLDSSGLRALIDVASECESTGRAFALASPSPRVARLLGMVGLDGRFPVIDDPTPEALSELGPGSSAGS